VLRYNGEWCPAVVERMTRDGSYVLLWEGYFEVGWLGTSPPYCT